MFAGLKVLVRCSLEGPTVAPSMLGHVAAQSILYVTGMDLPFWIIKRKIKTLVFSHLFPVFNNMQLAISQMRQVSINYYFIHRIAESILDIFQKSDSYE